MDVVGMYTVIVIKICTTFILPITLPTNVWVVEEGVA